jgi:hypothetical protein
VTIINGWSPKAKIRVVPQIFCGAFLMENKRRATPNDNCTRAAAAQFLWFLSMPLGGQVMSSVSQNGADRHSLLLVHSLRTQEPLVIGESLYEDC